MRPYPRSAYRRRWGSRSDREGGVAGVGVETWPRLTSKSAVFRTFVEHTRETSAADAGLSLFSHTG
jgi:hypothetical protein